MLLADLQSSGALPADWEAAQPQVCPWRPASARQGATRPCRAVMRSQRPCCCPAQAARLVRWLTQRNPAQRPSAVEVLRSELLPPSVADEQLTDLLRSIPERCE